MYTVNYGLMFLIKLILLLNKFILPEKFTVLSAGSGICKQQLKKLLALKTLALIDQ